ncbi:hypothetical protein HY251_05355, partial [bacterium]|nr:hypothetical protein [bacterium]
AEAGEAWLRHLATRATSGSLAHSTYASYETTLRLTLVPRCGAIPFSPGDAGREGACPPCRSRVRAPSGPVEIAETALGSAEAPTRITPPPGASRPISEVGTARGVVLRFEIAR